MRFASRVFEIELTQSGHGANEDGTEGQLCLLELAEVAGPEQSTQSTGPAGPAEVADGAAISTPSRPRELRGDDLADFLAGCEIGRVIKATRAAFAWHGPRDRLVSIPLHWHPWRERCELIAGRVDFMTASDRRRRLEVPGDAIELVPFEAHACEFAPASELWVEFTDHIGGAGSVALRIVESRPGPGPGSSAVADSAGTASAGGAS
jgi:hypothetical protein